MKHHNINLTLREVQVLELISQGCTSTEIAHYLFISTHTVISHRKKLLEKMDARNTAGLVRRAFEMNYLHVERMAL